MTKFLLPLLLSICIVNLSAQVAFQKKYGLNSKEYEKVERALLTPQGDLLIAGITESGEQGAYDFFLQKIQADGTESWLHTYGTADMDYLSDITPAVDGGYFISGYTVGPADSTFDAVLAKVDAAGVLLWWKTFGNEATELGRSVCQRLDGSVVLLGTTARYTAGDSDFHPAIFQIVYDQNGNFMADFETPLMLESSLITIKSVTTSDNGYLLHTSDGDFSGMSARLLKYGSSHELQWERSPAQILTQIGQPDGEIVEAKAGATEIAVVLNTSDGVYLVALGYATGDVAWFKKVTGIASWTGVEVFSNGEIGVAALSDNHLIAEKLSASGLVLDSVATEAPSPFFRPIFRFNGFTHLYEIENVDFDGQPDYTIAQADLTIPTIVWQQEFGEQGVRDREYGTTITGTSDGGFVMAGNKDSEDASWNTWLVKADAQGNILWERVYTLNTSLSSYEVPTSVKTDAQGNIILLVATSAFEPDYRLLKISPDGDLIFDKLVKQAAFHYYASALPLAEGGYVVGMILLSDFSQPIRPAILRLDANGDVLWEKTYPPGIYIYGIEAIPDEGFVVVGRKFVDNVFHPWMQKTDLDGNVLWERIYDVDSGGNLQSIVRAADGTLWAAGDNFYLSTKQVKALVLKLDSSGDEIWRSEFSKGEFTYWYSNNILPEADGSACLFGRFSKSSPTLPVYNSHLRIRMSLAKIDSSGAMIAEQTFGTDSSYPEVYEAAHTVDGDVVMCATVRPGTAQQDAWVVKTDCSATVSVSEQQTENLFHIVPNPVRSKGEMWLTSSNNSGKILHLGCFDISGKKLWEKQITVADTATGIVLPAPEMPGVYIMEIIDEHRARQVLRITVY